MKSVLTSGHWHSWSTAGIPRNEDVSGAVTMAESRAECMWLLDRLAPKEPLPNSLVRSSLLPSESTLEDEETTVPHRNNTSVVNSPPTARAGGEVWRERGWQSQLLLGAPK